MKNTPDGVKSRLDMAEEMVSEFKDRAIETIQNEAPRSTVSVKCTPDSKGTIQNIYVYI